MSKLRINDLESLDTGASVGVDVLAGVPAELDRRVIYVDTIADLQALDAEPGQAVYLTQNGRAGEFVVKAGTPPIDPQQGIFVFLENGNYAQRVNFGALRFEFFGAAGDGVTDDTGAVQALVNYVNNLGGGSITSDSTKHYLTDEPLRFTVGDLHIDLQGALIELTTPLNIGGSRQDSAGVNVRNDSRQLKNVVLRNIRLTGVDVSDGGEVWGIHVSWVKYFEVSGCEVYDANVVTTGSDAGIRVDGYGSDWGVGAEIPRTDEGPTSYGKVFNNNLHDIKAGSGIEFIASPTHIQCFANTTKRTAVNGLRCAGLSNSTVTNNLVEEVYQNHGLYLSTCRFVTASHNRIRDIDGIGIYLQNIEDSHVTDNTLFNVTDGIYGNMSSQPYKVARCVISRNYINEWDKTGGNVFGILVRGAGCDNNTIEDNVLINTGSTGRGISLAQSGDTEAPKFNTVKNNKILCENAQKLQVDNASTEGGTNIVVDNYDLATMKKIGDQAMSEIIKNGGPPTTGQWYRGDVVFNRPASVGFPIGWMCVESGTPGTWGAMPDLVSV